MRELRFRALLDSGKWIYLTIHPGHRKFEGGSDEYVGEARLITPWFQSCGLKDKNGVEIFESDLVDWDGDVYEVRFNEGEWQLFNSGDMEGDRPSLYRISSPKQSRMVIVGDIYENKKR